MTLTFEWHDAKARSNKSKHGVSFETACLAFSDPYYTILRRPDPGKITLRRIYLARSEHTPYFGPRSYPP